jgi:hypothetical protein
MLTPQQNTPFQAAMGQYVTVKQTFTSDVMLTGDVLKFHPQLYADGTTRLTLLTKSFTHQQQVFMISPIFQEIITKQS